MGIHQKEIFFYLAITILSLLTYSVCDGKVKQPRYVLVSEYLE